jgi:sugar-specific transcriptional regulator TrmB/DNA-binding CsgD family transcriptional regulator
MSVVTLGSLTTVDGVTDDREAEVYRYAVRLGEIASPERAAADLGLPAGDVFAAVTRLVELHLLRTDGLTGRYLPMDPEVAATLLISPIERAMYQRRELADRLRERIDAITRPAVEMSEPVGAIDSLEGVAEIRGLFKLAAEVCRNEMVVLRPGYDDEELLDELLAPCYSVLERSVSVRVVCPHRSRAGFASRAKARRLAADGAEIRTLSQVPQAAVVFDRSLAVMFSIEDGLPVARRVRDRNVVRFLLDMFGQLWDSATPFATEETSYADAIDDLQQSVARLMAQGLTDEVVARRLGMSVRTCRRHIAALLQNLDAVSRFQAGVLAASRLTMTA